MILAATAVTAAAYYTMAALLLEIRYADAGLSIRQR